MIKLNHTNLRYYKSAIIYWIGTLVAFGPLQMLLRNNENEGTILSNHQPSYFMLQGLFISTISKGIVYTINRALRRRMPENEISD
jgi:hypothetical protein